MTTHELISYCYYDNLNEKDAQDFIKRCYSLDLPLKKIMKEYEILNNLSGRI